MKHFKKMMALIIAFVMIVGTLSMGAFAAEADATITITGLDDGDTVKLYQVLKWDNGWKLTDNFTGLNTPGINDIIANKPNTEVDADDIAAITALISDSTNPTNTQTLNGSTTYTYSPTDNPGMFIALIDNAKEGVIYNPIVISADFSDTTPNSIPASSYTYGTSIPKKTEEHVFKTVAESTSAINKAKDSYVGEIVDFDVDTFIPGFGKSSDPALTIHDEIVDEKGIDLVEDSLIITVGTQKYGLVADTAAGIIKYDEADPKVFDSITFGTKEYTIVFDTDYLKTIAAPTDIHIDYQGKITSDAKYNVNEAKNEVTVTFTNNGKTYGVRDRTNHYTFSIGADLLGADKGITSELWKAGVNSDGTPAIESSTDSWGGTRHPLEGAVFGLFTSKAAADAYTSEAAPADKAAADAAGFYTNDLYPASTICTTAGDGTLTFKGLASGTYYLKELKAPTGFIKDTSVTEITITAEYKEVKVPATTEGSGTSEVQIAGYTTEILDRYTVSVNNVYVYDSDKDEYGIAPGSVVNVYTYDNEDDVPEISNLTDEKALQDAIKANPKGVELPSTGGIGTTIFYVIGALLILGAGILLVTRRRMREE